MAAVTSAKVKLTNRFADDSTAAIEFTNVENTQTLVEDVRTNVKNFDVDAIKATYISETGSQLAEIKSATVTVTTDEEINLNVEE